VGAVKAPSLFLVDQTCLEIIMMQAMKFILRMADRTMPWQPPACLKVDMECCAQVVQASRHKSRQFFDKDYFFHPDNYRENKKTVMPCAARTF